MGAEFIGCKCTMVAGHRLRRITAFGFSTFLLARDESCRNPVFLPWDGGYSVPRPLIHIRNAVPAYGTGLARADYPPRYNTSRALRGHHPLFLAW